MLYLEYTVNYQRKNYVINEFNGTTKQWDSPHNKIKLYELVFDNYFVDKNPNLIVENGVPVVITPDTGSTESEFTIVGPNDVDLDEGVNSTFSKSVLTYVDGVNFQSIRSRWANIIDLIKTKYKKSVVVKNNSDVPIYLKGVEIELLGDNDSTRHERLTGNRKASSVTQSVYTLDSVPNYKMEWNEDVVTDDSVLQANFDRHYHPELTDDTVSVVGVDVVGTNYYNSAAFKAWYYPINSANFFERGRLFGEQLHVAHHGNDLSPIPPNGELDLTLSWGFGEDYALTNVESYYYKLCLEPAMPIYASEYKVNVEYRVTLLFNDLQNTLAESANTVSFNVKSLFEFEYVGGDYGKPVVP